MADTTTSVTSIVNSHVPTHDEWLIAHLIEKLGLSIEDFDFALRTFEQSDRAPAMATKPYLVKEIPDFRAMASHLHVNDWQDEKTLHDLAELFAAVYRSRGYDAEVTTRYLYPNPTLVIK